MCVCDVPLFVGVSLRRVPIIVDSECARSYVRGADMRWSSEEIVRTQCGEGRQCTGPR